MISIMTVSVRNNPQLRLWVFLFCVILIVSVSVTTDNSNPLLQRWIFCYTIPKSYFICFLVRKPPIQTWCGGFSFSTSKTQYHGIIEKTLYHEKQTQKRQASPIAFCFRWHRRLPTQQSCACTSTQTQSMAHAVSWRHDT